LWLAFIGWFLLNAARAEEAAVTTRDVLGGVRVRDVMSVDPITVPASLTVAELLDRFVLGSRHSAYPVRDGMGHTTGLVTLAQVRELDPAARASTLVGAVAIPAARVPATAPDDALVDVLGALDGESGGRALVFDGDRLTGIVTTADVARAIDLSNIRRPRAA
jgi:CBS domain-containing protein